MLENTQEQDVITEPDFPDNRSGCAGCGWGLIGGAGCLAVPLMIIALALFMGVATIGGIFDSITGIFRTEPRQAVVETTRTIVTSVQSMSRLTTTQAGFVRSNVRVSVRDGFQNTCGASASHNVEGRIEAGLDLSLITDDNITYDTLSETYTITLPPVQLTNCSIPTIDQYDRSFTVCNANWDDMRQIAQYEALTGFRDDALESDLLQRSERDSEAALANLLSPLIGSGNIEIEIGSYLPGEDAVVDPSCVPDPPLGWTYDANNGTWSD